jgi:hypothetical protein
MTKRTRTGLLLVVIALIGAASFYAYQQEDSFMVEFGESTETREAFIALLTEHAIAYHTKTDHVGRVWVVPDQTKRKEYEAVRNIWERSREEDVRKANEARRL